MQTSLISLAVVVLLLAPSATVDRKGVPTSFEEHPSVTMPMRSGVAKGPSTAIPSSSSPGNVSWTLCLLNNDLLVGNAECPNDNIEPYAAAYDSDNGHVYVTKSGTNNVSVINGTTDSVIASIEVGNDPWGVTFDSGSGYLYVANANTNNVSVINGATDSVVTSIPVGSLPDYVGYDSGNGYLYVTNRNSNDVTVINGATDSVVSSIAVGTYPGIVAYDSRNGYLYVTNFDSSNVSVINGATDSVVTSIGVGGNPDGLAYDGENGYTYVANAGSDDVSVIDGTTDSVVGTISVLERPIGIAYDSGNGYLYVTDRESNSVSVINGATDSDIASIAAGNNAWGVTYDSANGNVYVTNQGSDSISIITFPTYSISFSESGLPAGTNWSVALSGQEHSSTISTMSFSVDPGNYSYSVGQVPGFAPTPRNGNVTLFLENVNLTITFSKASGSYEIGFEESGLPVSTLWSVSVGAYSQNSTTTQISIAEPNSTYSYTVGLVPGYQSSPSAGDVIVEGGPQQVLISFAKIAIPPITSVFIDPPSASVPIGGAQVFNATPTCQGGPCPTSVFFAWLLSSSLGSLNITSGHKVTFTAGGSSGNLSIEVFAVLNGLSVNRTAFITIPSDTPYKPPLSSADLALIIGAIIVAIVVIAWDTARKKGKRLYDQQNRTQPWEVPH